MTLVKKAEEIDDCPFCKESLKGEMGVMQEGTVYFKISLVGDGIFLDYDGMDQDKPSWYYCKNCGKPLKHLDEKDVVKIEQGA